MKQVNVNEGRNASLFTNLSFSFLFWYFIGILELLVNEWLGYFLGNYIIEVKSLELRIGNIGFVKDFRVQQIELRYVPSHHFIDNRMLIMGNEKAYLQSKKNAFGILWSLSPFHFPSSSLTILSFPLTLRIDRRERNISLLLPNPFSIYHFQDVQVPGWDWESNVWRDIASSRFSRLHVNSYPM